MTNENPAALISELERLSLRGGPPLRISMPSGPAWLVRNHSDARAVLSDARVSADYSRPGFPHLLPVPVSPGGMSFFRMDPPRHGVLRKVLTSFFTVRRTEKLAPGITSVTRKLLEAMRESGPPSDLVQDFTLPLPSLVICLLLGVPYSDHSAFQTHSRNLVSTTATREEGEAAWAALSAYLAEMVRERQRNPGPDPDADLIGRAVARQAEAGMSDEEVVAMARLILVAGHETTTNALSMTVHALFREPELMDGLRARPDTIPQLVEETLRQISIVHTGVVARVAREDIDLSGATIKAGEGVLLGLRAANRDPAVYPNPHRIDPSRDPRGHVAFGYGIHQCIGQALARLEIRIALTELLSTFPRLSPAIPLADIQPRKDALITGLAHCPVTW
ncbi:cytochrome P450 [Streptomyces capillispiralis]|uniref:cytochrome P450 n=1 Tax=Streptomyces capillispiralis TaxID=68182 RepID=UPI0036C6F8CD